MYPPCQTAGKNLVKLSILVCSGCRRHLLSHLCHSLYVQKHLMCFVWHTQPQSWLRYAQAPEFGRHTEAGWATYI